MDDTDLQGKPISTHSDGYVVSGLHGICPRRAASMFRRSVLIRLRTSIIKSTRVWIKKLSQSTLGVIPSTKSGVHD